MLVVKGLKTLKKTCNFGENLSLLKQSVLHVFNSSSVQFLGSYHKSDVVHGTINTDRFLEVLTGSYL